MSSQVLSAQVTARPNLEAWIRFLRAHSATTRALSARLEAEHGLTLNDYDVLVQLYYAPDQRMRRIDLARTVLLTASGITRLNVYAGEAAGYLITDNVDQRLTSTGVIPSDMIPLVIQDRTFVPGPAQLAAQDPTWDSSRWGSPGNLAEGSLWFHHVYMPAENPSDPTGMSAFGRWFYGPYFWPPQNPTHGPIANPYFNPACDPNLILPDGSTQFCEPSTIPGTPNISAGMEQFNDTPVVNGTAYPTTTVDPATAV